MSNRTLTRLADNEPAWATQRAVLQRAQTALDGQSGSKQVYPPDALVAALQEAGARLKGVAVKANRNLATADAAARGLKVTRRSVAAWCAAAGVELG